MPEEDDRLIGRTSGVVAGTRRVIPRIWEGVVADGAVTLLSAPEKVGQTTLLSLLLDRRRAGDGNSDAWQKPPGAAWYNLATEGYPMPTAWQDARRMVAGRGRVAVRLGPGAGG
jgi:hypothetical protein